MAASKPDCLFCKIVAGELPNYTVWEDGRHLAFLTPYPNTEGFTVLITKDHYDSYFAELPGDVLADFMRAAATVAKRLDAKFEDVGRTGLMLEGFGINHIHAKLAPMHGTKGDWTPRPSSIDTYFDSYPGYISSHDGPEADGDALQQLADRLRS